ncbi:MAG: hypothetical protein ACXVMS_05800 [Flavisolibacter sp.]
MNTHEILAEAIGAEYCTRERGRFEVHFGARVKTFERLMVAFFFYYELTEPASLWDMTEQPTLVERKENLSAAIPASRTAY